MSDGDFLGTGGAGFRIMLNDFDDVDPRLDMRGLASGGNSFTLLLSCTAMDVDCPGPVMEDGTSCLSIPDAGLDGTRFELWLKEPSLQSGSAVEVKGFEGLFGLTAESWSGTLIFDRAGSPFVVRLSVDNRYG